MIAVPLYLALVASLSSGRAWLLPLGLPVAGLALAFWGGTLWLWVHSRVPRGYAAAFTVLFFWVLGLGIHPPIDAFVEADPNHTTCVLVTWSFLGLAAVMGWIAWLTRLRRRRE